MELLTDPKKRQIYWLLRRILGKDWYWIISYIFTENLYICVSHSLSVFASRVSERIWFGGLKFRHGKIAQAEYMASQIRWCRQNNFILPS